jgi:protein O-mannosyl-transferase
VILYGVIAAAILGGYVALRVHALGVWFDPKSVTQLDNPLVHAEPLQRWLTPVAVAARYASLWVWPKTLCVERGFDTVPLVTSVLDLHFVIGAGILLAGSLALLSLAARRSPWGLPIAACGLAYLPASNLLVLVPALMGERFVYLPSLFLCVLAGGLYARLCDGGSGEPGRAPGWPFGVWGLHALAAALIVVAGARTFVRGSDFADELTLYGSAAASCPRSAKAQYNLGNALTAEHREAEAVEAYSASVAIAPWLAIAHNNMGSAYLNIHKFDEAEKAYEHALELEPRLVKTHSNLAMVLYLKGKLQPALDEARTALALNPDPDDVEYLNELVKRIERRLHPPEP